MRRGDRNGLSTKLIANCTLDEINQGFDDSKSGKTTKPVIIF